MEVHQLATAVLFLAVLCLYSGLRIEVPGECMEGHELPTPSRLLTVSCRYSGRAERFFRLSQLQTCVLLQVQTHGCLPNSLGLGASHADFTCSLSNRAQNYPGVCSGRYGSRGGKQPSGKSAVRPSLIRVDA